MQVKKFIVLAVLFLLPITAYLFFASGKDNFVKLPTLSYGVSELSNFTSIQGDTIRLQDRITVLTFFGKNVEAKNANAFNLAHKIYKKNHRFNEFQFVSLITEDQKEAAILLKKQLNEIEDASDWNFAVSTSQEIQKIFRSMKTNYVLDKDHASNYVFIVDKDMNLRGRDDDEDFGILYGFDASNYAEINNKMSDDIKVVLAEYRLALKKYKAEREI